MFNNLIGQKLGKYELLELLGVGGMGAVYRARDTFLKREVALKIINLSLIDPKIQARFNREAETAASLEHSHIVRVYDYGIEGRTHYIVMQNLTGGSISERLNQAADHGIRGPSLSEISQILNNLASALDYAHAQGVIHRDIKPQNVMFNNQGQVFIVDLGIAKLTNATNMTGTGMAMGTPNYMPPEQWSSDGISPAADQYALAVMIYQMIANRLPFEADTPMRMMSKHLYEQPTPLSSLVPDIPAGLLQVMDRAMAKNPQERFPNCTQFAQAFAAAVSGIPAQQTGFTTFKLTKAAPVEMPPLLPQTPPSQQQPLNTPSIAIPAAQGAQGTQKGGLPRSLLIALGGLVVIIALAVAALSGSRGAGSAELTVTALHETLVAGGLLLPEGGTSSPIEVIPSLTPRPSSTPEQAETPPPSPTSTETVAPTLTHTTTLSPTPSETATRRPTRTPIATETASITPPPTATQTLTPSRTPSNTATNTPTRTPTHTATRTLTPTRTPSNTATNTPQPTRTPTSTPGSTGASVTNTTGRSIFIRSNPVEGSTVIAGFNKDKTMPYISHDSTGAWVEVQIGSNHRGWVPANQVRVSGLEPAAETSVRTVSNIMGRTIFIRSEPVDAATLLARFVSDQTFPYIRHNDTRTWVQVQINNSQTGWVKASEVQIGREATSAAEASVRMVSNIAGRSIFIRANPVEGSTVIAGFNKDKTMPYISHDSTGAWVQVQIGSNHRGWVSADQVQISGGEPETAETRMVSNIMGITILIRAHPNETAAAVAGFSQNNTMPYVSHNSNGTWVQVELNSGQRGWVRAEQVMVSDGTPEPAERMVSNIAGITVLIRAHPNETAGAIAGFGKNDALPYISHSSDSAWVQVELSNGQQGWVRAEQVMVSDGDAEAVGRMVANIMGRTILMRSNPNESAGAIAGFGKDDTLPYLGRDSTGLWVQVEISRSHKGWVLASQVEIR